MNRLGEESERLAADLLARNGLRILARNYRTRFGEIDLVARDGATLVFVEVRQRRSAAFGGAAGSITPSKRRRIILSARQYLSASGIEAPCRFDAVLIEGDPPQVDWIRDAFGE